MERYWVNGSPGRLIDIEDRGLAYGDGLFETIAIRYSKLRFLDFHLDRLYAGATRLNLPVPDRHWLGIQLAGAIAGIEAGVMKLILTRGPGPRGYAPPLHQQPTVAWGVERLSPVAWTQIRVRWCETIAGRSAATAGLKTLGRIEQVLARAEWQDVAIAEGLMCDEDGLLVGGTASNVFIISDGRLLTPAITRSGICGVMRRIVMQQARETGIEVHETQIGRTELLHADELFVSNALTGIRPVRQLDDRHWSPGPVTRRLAALIADLGVDECSGNC